VPSVLPRATARSSTSRDPGLVVIRHSVTSPASGVKSRLYGAFNDSSQIDGPVQPVHGGARPLATRLWRQPRCRRLFRRPGRCAGTPRPATRTKRDAPALRRQVEALASRLRDANRAARKTGEGSRGPLQLTRPATGATAAHRARPARPPHPLQAPLSSNRRRPSCRHRPFPRWAAQPRKRARSTRRSGWS
jgi:hypothetical protein